MQVEVSQAHVHGWRVLTRAGMRFQCSSKGAAVATSRDICVDPLVSFSYFLRCVTSPSQQRTTRPNGLQIPPVAVAGRVTSRAWRQTVETLFEGLMGIGSSLLSADFCFRALDLSLSFHPVKELTMINEMGIR